MPQGAGDKFTQAESLGDDMDLSVALKNVKDALDRNPDLDVLVGIWAYNAHAIVEVVKQRGIRDKTTVVVFDAAPKAIGHMADGNIDAMVVQNPYDMGYRGTRLMKALVAGRPRHDSRDAARLRPRDARSSPSPTAICWSPGLRVVHPDSGSPLTKEMFAPTTEFLSLERIQEVVIRA